MKLDELRKLFVPQPEKIEPEGNEKSSTFIAPGVRMNLDLELEFKKKFVIFDVSDNRVMFYGEHGWCDLYGENEIPTWETLPSSIPPQRMTLKPVARMSPGHVRTYEGFDSNVLYFVETVALVENFKGIGLSNDGLHALKCVVGQYMERGNSFSNVTAVCIPYGCQIIDLVVNILDIVEFGRTRYYDHEIMQDRYHRKTTT